MRLHTQRNSSRGQNFATNFKNKKAFTCCKICIGADNVGMKLHKQREAPRDYMLTRNLKQTKMVKYNKVCIGDDVNSKSEDKSVEPDYNNYSVGSIVWAKLKGCRWWPAMVIDESKCALQICGSKEVCVFWFVENTVSKVPKDMLCNFKNNFIMKCGSLSKSDIYKRAILKACKECATTNNLTNEELILWARKGFVRSKVILNSDNVIPKYILKALEDIAGMQAKEKKKAQLANTGTKQTKRKTMKKSRTSYGNEKVSCNEDIMKKVKDGAINLNDVCIICFNDIIKSPHPLFQGGVCGKCLVRLKVRMFCFDANDQFMYCTVCGCSGAGFQCTNRNCSRWVCLVCITRLENGGAKQIIRRHPAWACFLCAEQPHNGLITRREDWRLNILNIYSSPMQDLSHCSLNNVQPIRVLSLLGTIGNELQMLNDLGLEVKVLYVCQGNTRTDTTNSVNSNFESRVTYLNGTTDLQAENIFELGPIDLLLGGSFYSEDSKVNQPALDIYGSKDNGALFFEFYRIWCTLMYCHKDHHLFWIYENIETMLVNYKDTISRYLMYDPICTKVGIFLQNPQTQHVWTNIPGWCMKHTPQINLELQENNGTLTSENSQEKLGDVKHILKPLCSYFTPKQI